MCRNPINTCGGSARIHREYGWVILTPVSSSACCTHSNSLVVLDVFSSSQTKKKKKKEKNVCRCEQHAHKHVSHTSLNYIFTYILVITNYITAYFWSVVMWHGWISSVMSPGQYTSLLVVSQWSLTFFVPVDRCQPLLCTGDTTPSGRIRNVQNKTCSVSITFWMKHCQKIFKWKK